jgi:hypothetical protein
VIAGADPSSVLPGDFLFPADDSSQQPIAVTLTSLDLFASLDSVHSETPTKELPTPSTNVTEPAEIQTYSALMQFSVVVNGEDVKALDVALSHDVFFATAHPCVPSSHVDTLLRLSRSPSSQAAEQGQSKSFGKLFSFSLHIPGLTRIVHPLHKGFTFTRLSLSAVLALPANLPFTSLLSPPQSPTFEPNQSTTHTTNSPIPKILVVDCTDSTTISFPTRPIPSPHSFPENRRSFGNDTEILARATCAERGWNAVVSRRGRICLSCSVREASALGWRVVLRFA